jgi:hypothetical protein
MNKNIKWTLVIVLIVVLIGAGGLFIWKKDVLIDTEDEIELTKLEKLDLEIKSGVWESFYPEKDWIETIENEEEMPIMDYLYGEESNVSYKMMRILPVVRRIITSNSGLSIEGWVYDSETEEWLLLEFIILLKDDEVSEFEFAPSIDNTQQSVVFENGETTRIEDVSYEEALELFIPGEQTNLFFYYDVKSLSSSNEIMICNDLNDTLCTGLLVSDKYNNYEIVDLFPVFEKNQRVYIDKIFEFY